MGTATADDAAVYRLNDPQALVATTDFFTPIVDDLYDFGRIAATHALSDICAMGSTPILALALVGMPITKRSPKVIGRVLEGGATVCRKAGILIAGGHSIDVPAPIDGLVGLGLVRPDRVRRNADAKAGDVLVLGQSLCCRQRSSKACWAPRAAPRCCATPPNSTAWGSRWRNCTACTP